MSTSLSLSLPAGTLQQELCTDCKRGQGVCFDACSEYRFTLFFPASFPLPLLSLLVLYLAEGRIESCLSPLVYNKQVYQCDRTWM
jgi:hypothetical protein